MARVQLAVVLAVLAAMLLLSFAAVTFVLTRSWDQGLVALCQVGTKRAEKRAEKQQGVKWVQQEMEEHRPIGVRMEIQDLAGAVLGADGKGPPLLSRGEGCRNQGSYRVCERHAAGLHILTGVSRADGLRDRDLFLAASAGIALFLALAAVASTRSITRRALAGLSRMARSIATLQPGTAQRVPAADAHQELEVLAGSFNQLLARVEEALASERRFTAEASHELRTPLTVLRAEVEGLTRGEAPGGPAARALEAVDGLIRLVEALLWLARSQGPLDEDALEVVNLADLARAQAARVGASYPGRDVKVEAPDEVLVAADEPLLARAVTNLVDNALKHAPAPAGVRVAVSERADQAQLEVEDEGPGIGLEVSARIFEPFFRGGPARGRTVGFGLGLPFAHSVARALGRRLSHEPSSVGTRFVLTLPILTGTEPSPTESVHGRESDA
jgi:signal transduction histidine kinase